MDWLIEKIDNVIKWFLDTFTALFTALTTWLKDFLVWIFDLVLSAVAGLIELVPVPDFMLGGLTGLFSALPQGLLYLLVETGIPQGLSIIGAGVLFNLTRKALTLGQW